MSLALLTAGLGQSWETELVAALDQPGAPLMVLQRCADLAQVLAMAGTGQASACVLAANLRRLDSDTLARLRVFGVAVVVVYPAADQRAPVRFDRIGVSAVVADDAGSAAIIAAIQGAIGAATPEVASRALSETRLALTKPAVDAISASAGPSAPPATGSAPQRGAVVAVWGPAGSPGRTTVAMGLADVAATAGVPTLLIDADVYGGVLANAFGLLDESPGLAGACRMAANGTLDRPELTRLCWSISPTLSLLTGIARTDRWPEVRPSALPLVLTAARSMVELVVVDCAFCLESDEEITFDTMAPRRNGATLAVLGVADLVLAVGSADPPGMERLVRGLAELAQAVPEAQAQAVLNRTRRSAASAEELADTLRRFVAAEVFAMLPEDRPATDIAWRRGAALSAVAAKSPLYTALGSLFERVRDRLGLAGAKAGRVPATAGAPNQGR